MSEIELINIPVPNVRSIDQSDARNDTAVAARELLKNGILVETNKGLVCMSLKDALNEGVGGHSLSEEDFQNVATELLFQEEPNQTIISDSIMLVSDNDSSKSKKAQKAVKKVGTKTKCNSNKIPILSATDEDDIHVNLDEALIEYSTIEYPSVLKVEEIDYPSVLKVEEINTTPVSVLPDNIKTVSFVQKPSAVFTNEKSLVNKRSLILKNNIKPVISVQKIVKNISNGKGTSSKSKYKTNQYGSVLIDSNNLVQGTQIIHESYVSCEETSDNSEVTSVLADASESKPVKKRGGWPKGRKRKPEVRSEIRPPKAPATGYVLFLNEKRKDYRDRPFTEVTKLLGNEWSRLSLHEKKVYLDQAEIEKKRYREELKSYRQSDAYQIYLHKKRLKRLQGNGTEESDMDATDEIDEEDNEELYCRACDQWFHSLHNKKEHLYGRQHLQSIAGRCTRLSDQDGCSANMSSTSLDESSLDGSSYLNANKEPCCGKNRESLSMDDAIVRFMVLNKEREEERTLLRKKLDESQEKNLSLTADLQQLNKSVDSLQYLAENERRAQAYLEQRLFNLLNVPTLFYLPDTADDENN